MRRFVAFPCRLALLLLAGLASAAPAGAGEPYPDYEFSIDIRTPRQDRENAVLFAPSAAPLTGELLLSGTHDRPLPIRVVALLDYRETPLSGDTPAAAAKSLEVPVGAALRVPFAIPPGSDGQHLLLVLVFFFPDQHATSADFRRDSRFLFSYAAARVRWGREGGAGFAIEDCRAESRYDPAAREGTASFSLRSAADEASPWFRAARAETGFVASFNNASGEDRTFLLLALEDFAQVPLNAGRWTVCSRLPPFAATRIPGRLPEVRPGAHEFLTVLVAEPFPLEGSWDPEVEVSQRVLVPGD